MLLVLLRVEEEAYGLYDAEFGAALRTVVEVTLLSGFVWWSVQAIRERDSQRRRAERELHESERRLSRTLASITDGLMTFDRDWRFTYLNTEAERLLRRPRTELLGKSVWDKFRGMVGTPLHRELQRAATERIVLEVESPAEDGARHFSNRVYPTEDGGLSVYFRDVTLRKQAQDALLEADRRKDEFLATLAHELRKHQAELRAVVRAAAETSRPAIDAGAHELTIELPPEPVYVDGDPVRLAQVFSNLLNNAAKYKKRGGHVRIALSANAGEATVRVLDNGIGIARHARPSFREVRPGEAARTRSSGRPGHRALARERGGRAARRAHRGS